MAKLSAETVKAIVFKTFWVENSKTESLDRLLLHTWDCFDKTDREVGACS